MEIQLRPPEYLADKTPVTIRVIHALTLLGDAVKLVAKIGGYLGRNNDPPPGHQLPWQGYREFQLMCLGFALLAEE